MGSPSPLELALLNRQRPSWSPQYWSVLPRPPETDSTTMSRPGSIFLPHHGQCTSWYGEPLRDAVPHPESPCARRMASALCSVVLGVTRLPTQRPIRKGFAPHFVGLSRRMDSQAQSSADAR